MNGKSMVVVLLRMAVGALVLLSVLRVSAREPALALPQGEVLLEVHGAIGRTNGDGVARFDRTLLRALPRTRLTTHTSVTDGMRHFEGVLMRDLLRQVRATGRRVVATALNDYVIDFDVDEFDQYDVLVAWSMDGVTLQPSDKGPLWIVYPRDDYKELQDIRYDYRWVWQLVRLDVQ